MQNPKQLPRFYSGTSGLVLPVPNKLHYPTQFQDKSRLCYYASLFNSIEVNSSFYKVPIAKTMQKWAQDVPDNFTFTFKLWQGITHQKGLVFAAADVDRFMNSINAVAEKKGCLLVQFPPSVKADSMGQLHNLLSYLHLSNPNNEWKIAVEFRHSSWYNEKTYLLLEQHQMTMVIHDLPASATPMDPLDLDYVYLRFHGPNGGYRGSYTDDFLQEYAGYITEWLEEGKTVYAYFNNTMGDAVKNLTVLNSYIHNNQAG
jgi:uncharacterized protein YecE (DUF72 family)